MAKYVAFLRAINVGGSKIIRMEELRKILSVPGIDNVSTYIQSGNVVFEARKTATHTLGSKLEAHLEKQLGYPVEVFVRTPDELQAIIDHNPFKGKEKVEEMQYISFLSDEPDKKCAEELLSFNNEIDTFSIHHRELYANVVKNGQKSRFEPAFVERKLKVLSTTRNMKTVNKMLELSTA